MQNRFLKKILLTVLLFLFFVVIDNKCFASYDDFTIEFSKYNSSFPDYNYGSYVMQKMSSIDNTFTENDLKEYKYLLFRCNNNNLVAVICLSKTPFYCGGNNNNWIASSSSLIYFNVTQNSSTYIISAPTYFRYNYTGGSIYGDNIGSFLCTDFAINTTNTPIISNYYIYTNSSLENVYTKSNLTINDDSFPVVVVPPIVYETPTLYIDDMNLRKRFSWQFNIPMVRSDTKYYVFLENYNRISCSSVSATFRIFTVTTPEGYDYTDYENYMYYDNLEKKLYLPAGCEIKEYSCTGTNGDLYSLTLEDEFTTERELQQYGSYLDRSSFDSFMQQSGLGVPALSDIGGYYTYLYPTDFIVRELDSTNFILQLYNALRGTFSSVEQMMAAKNNKSYSDYFYYTFLHSFYYNNGNLSFNINDVCCSNSDIVSYENNRSFNIKNSTVYDFFRHTSVYDYTKNWLGGSYYSFQYIDSEDVSSMLPSGTSVEYLTSPFYKDNENSSSGGYITYDINEILQGDKIIDYSKEDNSIHNNFNGDYIENYTEGDDIVINNYYTTTIDKTSDEHLLHNIYIAILEIKTKLSDLGDNISNTTNNFSYNTENTVKYYFVPNKYAMDSLKEDIADTAEQHLGIIYQPFQRNSIYIWCYIWSCYK